MCGLVGVYRSVGNDHIISNSMEILRRLEYRGYDSAGLMYISDASGIPIYYKVVGPVSNLYKEIYDKLNNKVKICLAHTRWATTGVVSEQNCHPHHSMYNLVHLVHNGIIENHTELRSILTNNDYNFYGQTDSEVLANWIEFNLRNYRDSSIKNNINSTNKDYHRVIKSALSKVAGTYGLAIMYHGALYGFHKGNPLILGRSDESFYLCSDLNALSGIADEGCALSDNSSVYIDEDGVHIENGTLDDLNEIKVTDSYELGNYESFTQKEILSQSDTLSMTIAGRYQNGEIRISALDENKVLLSSINRVRIIAEGTSYHAGLVGRYLIEKYAGLRTQVELASEFNNSSPIVDKDELFIFISQSGETADVIHSLREAKMKNCHCMGITNGVDSQLARSTDFGIYLRCGIEIGVASTKAFTSTILVLSMLACYLGRQRRLTSNEVNYILNPIGIPTSSEINKINENISKFNRDLLKTTSFIFLGTGPYYPIAMEGALKMNELSYISCLSYATGSLKHGPLSLVNDNRVFVILDLGEENRSSVRICIDELYSRGARMILFTDSYEGQREGIIVYRLTDNREVYSMIEVSIALQILAYHISKELGNNIDKPRNLAKSVTVK